MNLNFNSISCHSITFIKDLFPPPLLTVKQQKIFAIAALAFGFLATLYLICQHCFKASQMSPDTILFDKKPVIKTDIKVAVTDDNKQDIKESELHPSQSYAHFTHEELKIQKLSGKGTILFVCGGLYEGEFKEGMFNGMGQLTVNGKRYKGQFKDDQLEGQGSFIDSNETIHKGIFQEGELIKGKILNSNGTTYIGSFQKGKLEGVGIETSEDGTVLTGEFANGKLHGKGKRAESSGKIYEGQFISGTLIKGIIDCGGNLYEGQFSGLFYSLNGAGKISLIDGTIYEGEFEDDELNGEGKITYPNGNIEEGVFIKNTLI